MGKEADANFHGWSLAGGGEIFSQDADVREIPVALHEIEPVANDEFIFDLKPDIVGIDRARSDFLFAQEHANTNASRLGRLEFVADRGERVTTVQNIVEDENV